MKTTPDAMKDHCAALAKVRADRQLNSQYRQGGAVARYDAAEAARAAERECLEKLKKREDEKRPAAN